MGTSHKEKGLSAVRRWFKALQSEWLLPFARGLHVIAAVCAIATVAIGLLLAVVFHLGTRGSASVEPLPQTPQLSPPTIDVDQVRRRLAAPSNIRFELEVDRIGTNLLPDATLGSFSADTANELRPYPDDFVILGGRDAAAVRKVRYPGTGRTGLAPSASLIAEIDAMLAGSTGTGTRSIELTVLASDRYLNSSKPETVTFTLRVAKDAQPTAVRPQHRKTTQSPLEALAAEIAAVADPQRTTRYFDFYKEAIEAPAKCGAANNEQYVANMRTAFDTTKAALNRANVVAFLDGVCEAWGQAVATQEETRQKADAARQQVAQRNSEELIKVELRKAAASTARWVALSTAGAALTGFLGIAFLLAFLAMESHSKAIRDAVEALAKPDGGMPSSAADSPSSPTSGATTAVHDKSAAARGGAA